MIIFKQAKKHDFIGPLNYIEGINLPSKLKAI